MMFLLFWCCWFPLCAALLGVFASAEIFFSEYLEGSSNNKAIELFNPDAAAVDLAAYEVKVFTNGGNSFGSLKLSGKLDGNSVFVITNPSAYDLTLKVSSMNGRSVTTFNGNDPLQLLKNGVVLDVIGYPKQDKEFGKDITLSRKPEVKKGSTIFNPSDWDTHAKNDVLGLGKVPGDRSGGVVIPAVETGPDFGACDEASSRISSIQGSGSTTTQGGTYVVVQATVAQVTQSGYYLQQDRIAGDDQNASVGIYVFDNTNRPKERQVVRIKGLVAEYNDMTQISNVKADRFSICEGGSLHAIPEPIELSIPLQDVEKYEGMQVHVMHSKPIYISDTYSFRYGQLGLSEGSLRTLPTDKELPGSDAAKTMAADNQKNIFYIEDGYSRSNPDVISFYPSFDYSHTVRVGSLVKGDFIGALHQFKSDYQLVPKKPLRFDDSENPRFDSPEKPKPSGGAIRLASFNVLNYFNGYKGKDKALNEDDRKYWMNSQNGKARGANNKKEFSIQREKIITAIVKMEADVIGILEMENDGWDEHSAIYDLVINGLNKHPRNKNDYQFIKSEEQFIGNDVIKVSIVYNKKAVVPSGKVKILKEYPFDEKTAKNRPTMIQKFKDLSSGKTLTIAVNHLKSKRPSCTSMSDPADTDGQGDCNRLRVSCAETLGKYLEKNHANEDVLLVGDLNSYSKEDPVLVLTNGDNKTRTIQKVIPDGDNKFSAVTTPYRLDYVNLGPKFIKEESGKVPYFSYIFRGEVGSLDHALSSPSLESKVIQVQDWNINSAEPTILDYNQESKSPAALQNMIKADSPFRSSDHNPIIVDVNLLGIVTPNKSTSGSCTKKTTVPLLVVIILLLLTAF